ncbi:UNVERIFIED_CONTAM: hypothetical protein GTU68_053518 [Idotea baltica]|nr:hypothetical protein [Idotea baltica]
MIAKKTLAVILGGGAGTRLYPLTGHRSKPAVPIAGEFRLIDIPISNCLNSNINRMFVLTQYNSASLNRHIKNAYQFDRFDQGFVDILAAEQTPDSKEWFQGTADAVKQVVPHLERHDFDYIMILSGDQLYQMDFGTILNNHKNTNADVTVATIPVIDRDAPGFGLLKAGADGSIEKFVEKPPFEELKNWVSDVEPQYAEQGKHYLASMGIYVFSRGVLSKLFKELPEATDFGKEFIPYTVDSDQYKVNSFAFGDYWDDIGTIRSFYEANLRLTESLPEFNLYDNNKVVYTNSRMLSPSKLFGTRLTNALLSSGCIIHAESISRSVIGIRSRIGVGTQIIDSIVMGVDRYQSITELRQNPEHDLLGIGERCFIKRTIIDKNARIGNDCYICGGDGLEDYEDENYCIREGIVIVKKNGVIPSGTKISCAT